MFIITVFYITFKIYIVQLVVDESCPLELKCSELACGTLFVLHSLQTHFSENIKICGKNLIFFALHFANFNIFFVNYIIVLLTYYITQGFFWKTNISVVLHTLLHDKYEMFTEYIMYILYIFYYIYSKKCIYVLNFFLMYILIV